MPARSGLLIRPLLELSREQTHAYCEELGLGWREDETNLDRRFARNRVRLDVLPALREIHPAADRNVLATADQLREEAEVLERAVDRALEQVSAGGTPPAIEAARLRELDPGLRRLVLRRLAETVAGGTLPLRSAQVAEIERIGSAGGSAAIDLGGGVKVVSEYGLLRFQREVDEREPAPAELTVPGRCRFGDWEVVCEVDEDGARAADGLGSLDEARLDAGKLAGEVTVRSWHEGDRMRPLGLEGSKSLQDVFTDRKVPRSVRHTLPVVESGGEIAWVAGVALSERFKVTDETTRAARLRAVHSEALPKR
jgi:tRNA(Ile)-lysidine synthase